MSNFYFAKSSWTCKNALCSCFGTLLYIWSNLLLDRYSLSYFNYFSIYTKTQNKKIKSKLTRQGFFNVCANMVAIKPMTITHRKKVKTQLSEHIRNENICILVLLVRIARLVPYRSSKCKFSDTIKSLWCYFHGDFPSWLLVI